jgi:hypothetical protein
MKHLTLLLFFCTVFSACKKDFAHFQQSTYSSYSQSKTTVIPTPDISSPNSSLSASLDNSTVIFSAKSQVSEPTIELETNEFALTNEGNKKTKTSTTKRQKSHFLKVFPSKKHQNSKRIFEIRRKPVPLNSSIYTGFIILGIAVVLALVSLESLSLLFGLAAIVLLYIGFKKYFRRKKWRDIFR